MSAHAEFELNYLRLRANYLPWEARADLFNAEQPLLQDVLRRRAGASHFGEGCFISLAAHVYTDALSLGANSYIAAGAIVRGRVMIGDHASVNAYAHLAGDITLGDHVMIAGSASIYGFNHGSARTDIPMHRQPNPSLGVVIEDDVWVGANALILDGVRIGAHSIVAGGAVVTKSVPPYSIVGGNPARLIRDRRARETDLGLAS